MEFYEDDMNKKKKKFLTFFTHPFPTADQNDNDAHNKEQHNGHAHHSRNYDNFII
jgi:hypothetical protein